MTDYKQVFKKRFEELYRYLKASGKARTQSDMAKTLGITIQSMRNYRLGHRIPDSELQSKISRAFDVNLNWLASGEGNMLAELSPAEKILLERMREFDDPLQHSLLIAKAKYIQTELLEINILENTLVSKYPDMDQVRKLSLFTYLKSHLKTLFDERIDNDAMSNEKTLLSLQKDRLPSPHDSQISSISDYYKKLFESKNIETQETINKFIKLDGDIVTKKIEEFNILYDNNLLRLS